MESEDREAEEEFLSILLQVLFFRDFVVSDLHCICFILRMLGS